MKLEDKIEQLKGKLGEFIDSDSLKKLEKHSNKKAQYAFIKSNLECSYRGLLYKVVLFSELETIFKYCFEDNFERSKKDELISAELPLPKSGVFFKGSYENPLYCVPEKEEKLLEEDANNNFKKYIAGLNFWKEEVSAA